MAEEIHTPNRVLTLHEAINEIHREALSSTLAMFPEIPARKIEFILADYRDMLLMAFTEERPSNG